jgi:hypothetical protein
MKQVNPYYLETILHPIAGLADGDDDDIIIYKDLDPNNENEVKRKITEILKPYFEGFDKDSQEKIKISLSYYLTKSSIDFGAIFDSLLLPFESPENPKNFFIWVWEVFFSKEDYHLNNTDQYIESKDMYAPMRLKHISWV